MFGNDILGNGGRDALRACVKVAICGQPELKQYTYEDALNRVRKCFYGVFFDQDESLAALFEEKASYDIRDINSAFIRLTEQSCQVHPKDNEAGINTAGISTIRKKIDAERQCVEDEYQRSIQSTVIEHGSGFIVADGFAITNYHVVSDALGSTAHPLLTIRISNEHIRDLVCKVVHHDAATDLALLYSAALHLDEIPEVKPLVIAKEPLLPGMSIFAFGYPISHTGNTALLTHGYVSGIKKGGYRNPDLMILNCALNSGNSGGPIMCRVDDKVAVVGVARQKHFKQILEPQEALAIETIRESMRTQDITDGETTTAIHERQEMTQTSLALLTLKLYEALETHTQFNLSNALPSTNLVEFVNTYRSQPHDAAEQKSILTVVSLPSLNTNSPGNETKEPASTTSSPAFF